MTPLGTPTAAGHPRATRPPGFAAGLTNPPRRRKPGRNEALALRSPQRYFPGAAAPPPVHWGGTSARGIPPACACCKSTRCAQRREGAMAAQDSLAQQPPAHASGRCGATPDAARPCRIVGRATSHCTSQKAGTAREKAACVPEPLGGARKWRAHLRARNTTTRKRTLRSEALVGSATYLSGVAHAVKESAGHGGGGNRSWRLEHPSSGGRRERPENKRRRGARVRAARCAGVLPSAHRKASGLDGVVGCAVEAAGGRHGVVGRSAVDQRGESVQVQPAVSVSKQQVLSAGDVGGEVALHHLAVVAGLDAGARAGAEWDAAGQLARLHHHHHP
eukprot:scaffold2279_cov116-Isochrysis_galbana.AAC.5